MIKTAQPKKTAANSSVDENKPKNELNPKSQFIGASLSMSWQLAVVVLIPIVGGYKLDEHFKTSPLWVIFGFIVAMIGFFIIIQRVLSEFNENVYNKDKK